MNCGRDFQIAGGRLAAGGGAYCTDNCRVEHKAIPDRTCQTCGETFNTPHAENRYCSKICAGVARRTRVERSCETCGARFEEQPARVAQGRGRFCSKACQFPGPVDRTCERCGNPFTAHRSELAKGWGRFCSNKCRRTRTERVCQTCSSVFEVVDSKVVADLGKYCSVDCRGLAMRNRVTRTCVICGTEFERPASTVARTPSLYCSRTCNAKARREDPAEVARVRQMQRDQLASRLPTKPERILYALLDRIIGEGNWSSQFYVFDKWTVDAALPNLNLIIQADGDYWHGFRSEWQTHPLVKRNMGNDRAQNGYLAKVGWTLLRLWEHDLIDRPDWCADEIVRAVSEAQSLGATTNRPFEHERGHDAIFEPVPPGDEEAALVSKADGSELD